MPHRLRAVLAPASALLLTLLVTLVLGACSGDPKPKFAPSPSASPSVSVTSTPSPTAPVAPTMPAEAREFTESGARALVEHYWELSDYAQRTGDVSALRELATADCRACASGVRAIVELYADGGRIIGGSTETAGAEVSEVQLRNGPALKVDLTVTNKNQRVDFPGEERDGSFPAGTIEATFVVVPNPSHPRISFWDVQ